MSADLHVAVARDLARSITRAAKRHPGNEAAFRSEAENALADEAKRLGVDLDKQIEVTIAGAGRADAIYNRFIIEWEAPGVMAGHVNHGPNRHAVSQLQAYIEQRARAERHPKERYAGAACDGRFIIFARYRAGFWMVDEPVPVDTRAAEELVHGVLAAREGKALTADNLIRDFRGEGLIARSLCRAFLNHLDASLGHEPNGLSARLYRQWEMLFAVATGVAGTATELDRRAHRALAEVFDIRTADLDPARALFSLQTYFAVVTKLVASLALSLFVDAKWSLDDLASGGDEDLMEDLAHLERGDAFRAVGLRNVIEPDVFGWYLHGRNEPVCAGLRALAERLKE